MSAENERGAIDNAAICPHCGEHGFDGQGYVLVEGIQMYLRQCWDCGTRFACEDPDGVRHV